LTFFSYGQNSINYELPQDYQALVTYEVEKSTSFSLPDGTNMQDLPSSDVLQLIPKVERNQVSEYLLADGSVTKVITHLDSENLYPNWFKPSAVTVIDKAKVSKFDENGELVLEMEHEPLYRLMYKLSTINIVPENFGLIEKPTYLSNSEIATIENSGSTVASDAEGTITITKPLTPSQLTAPNTELQIRYHPESDFIEQQRIENGEVKRKSYQFNGYNYDNDYIINKKITLTNETTASGHCYEKIELEQFNKYQIKRWLGERSKSDNTMRKAANQFIEITPNPFNNQLIINLDATKYEFKTTGSLRVVDLVGRAVYQTTLDANTPKRQIVETTTWPAGAYLVIWTIDGNSETMKIIK
jgi:hypothetical protein